MYFRSLAVFAFAACATFVSAAPKPSPLELVAVRASADLALAMRDVAADTVAIVARDGAPAPAAPAALSSPTKILQNMTVKLTPIVQNLKAAVADKSKLKEEQIVGYMNDIITILTATRTELQAVAKNPTGFVTGVITLGTIFATLGPFLELILSVLALVLQVVADTPLGPVVEPLTATIGNLLEDVIALVLELLPGLLTLLAPVLAILSPILHQLQLDSLLSIINIPGLNL